MATKAPIRAAPAHIISYRFGIVTCTMSVGANRMFCARCRVHAERLTKATWLRRLQRRRRTSEECGPTGVRRQRLQTSVVAAQKKNADLPCSSVAYLAKAVRDHGLFGSGA
jgi:hypothetical protein